MPRAARSVATSTRRAPLLNSERALVRAPWLLLPWMAAAAMPSFSRRSAIRFAPCLVRENTSTCCQSLARIRWLSRSPLRSMSQGCSRCSTVGAARFSGVACSCTGCCNSPVASLLISVEKVAENSRFCRLGGIKARILWISRMKPISSMRSASSSTRISTRSSRRARCCCRSISLPGVATRMSVPRCRRIIWGLIFTPPNTTSLRRFR